MAAPYFTYPYKELNGFWLDSSLKISPFEQVKVLAKVFEGQSIYSEENIGILKKVMLIQKDDTKKVYGKTGSGPNGEVWFVGFTEGEGKRYYFAIYLNDASRKVKDSGNAAKEIALKIIK